MPSPQRCNLTCSEDLSTLRILLKGSHALCGLLWLHSSIWAKVVEVPQCCSTHRYFVALYGWYSIVLDVPHVVRPFIHRQASGLCPPSGYCGQCCYEHCYMCFCLHVCYSSQYEHRSGVSGSCGSVLLNCWETTKPFPTAPVLFYILISNGQGSQFFQILTNTCYFNYSHLSGNELLCLCDFHLHFPKEYWHWVCCVLVMKTLCRQTNAQETASRGPVGSAIFTCETERPKLQKQEHPELPGPGE